LLGVIIIYLVSLRYETLTSARTFLYAIGIVAAALNAGIQSAPKKQSKAVSVIGWGAAISFIATLATATAFSFSAFITEHALSTSSILNTELILNIGGILTGAKAAEGAYLTFSPDARKIPTAKVFIDAYEKKFSEIWPYSIYAYDAANVMLTAIKEAGTKDGKSIIEKLHSMEFNGAVGKIKFDAKGDVTVEPYVV